MIARRAFVSFSVMMSRPLSFDMSSKTSVRKAYDTGVELFSDDEEGAIPLLTRFFNSLMSATRSLSAFAEFPSEDDVRQARALLSN